MAKLQWNVDGERKFRTGVDKGALYQKSEDGKYPKGVAWEGLNKVTESPEGAERTTIYANNASYGTLVSDEKYKGNITAYTYPDEFAEAIGEKKVEAIAGLQTSGQSHRTFGFSFREYEADDIKGTDAGYVIHLVYNATAGVSSRDHETVNDSPAAATMSWDFDTTAVSVPWEGHKATAHLIFKSSDMATDKLKALEEALWGSDSKDAYLPTPEELNALLGASTQSGGKAQSGGQTQP